MANSTNRTKIGQKLVDLRKEKNYKQQYVADLINISRYSLAKYETSIVPPIDKLIAFAKIYDVSVDEIIGTSEKYNPSNSAYAMPTFSSSNAYLNNISSENSNNDVTSLSNDEILLISEFREADSDVQKIILDILKSKK